MDNNEITIETIQIHLFKECRSIEYCRLLACNNINTTYDAIMRFLSIIAYSLPVILAIRYLFKVPVRLDITVSIIAFYIIGLITSAVYKKKTIDNINYTYDHIKIELANIYFTKLSGYDKMEDWVKDKVFKEKILPYTGLQAMKTK